MTGRYTITRCSQGYGAPKPAKRIVLKVAVLPEALIHFAGVLGTIQQGKNKDAEPRTWWELRDTALPSEEQILGEIAYRKNFGDWWLSVTVKQEETQHG